MKRLLAFAVLLLASTAVAVGPTTTLRNPGEDKHSTIHTEPDRYKAGLYVEKGLEVVTGGLKVTGGIQGTYTGATETDTLTALTVTGAFVGNGAVTLGDAAADNVTVNGSLATDLLFKTGIENGADIYVAAGAANTAGSTLDLTGSVGGAATTDQVGKNGGAVTVTGGAGSAKNGSGATDGDGGDVVLLGGALGGTTGGTEVTGIVRVGSPTVGSTKATNLLAVGGGLEVDGAIKADGAVTLGDAAADDITITGSIAADVLFKTGISGGADVSVAAGAANTAGSTLDFVAGAGGTAGAGQVGKDGGALTLTGGAGSAKNGAGATDGNGGDLVLLGGARGGTTGGSEVQGIVRVGAPTVGSTKTTNLLAVGGGLEVDGASRFDGAATFNAGVNFGYSLVTTSQVLTAAECGKTYAIATDARTFTLPATVAGCRYRFINAGANGNNIVELIPDAADQVFGETRIANGTRLTIAGAAGEHILNTKATAVRGDRMDVEGDGADGWYITGSAGIWAEATP